MNSTHTNPNPAKMGLMKNLVIPRLVYVSVFIGLIGTVLFLSAGRLNWWEAWAFLAAYYAITLAGAIILVYMDPDLAQERAQHGKNTKTFDKVILPLNMFLTVVLLVTTGLDAGRFNWSVVPNPIRFLALVSFIPAFGLPLWASFVNTYLASTVRIQEERHHRVVTSGPYRFLHHPMYLGMLLYDLSLPLLLGSWWGALVGMILVLVLIVRTSLEDRTLQAELPGYAEYAQRVRYRLFPGIW